MRDRFRSAEGIFLAPDAAKPTEAQAVQTLASRRGRATVAAPPSASKAMTALLRPLLKDTGLGLAEMKRRWGDIAGEAYSKTRPVKLAGGTLTIHAPSALAPFIQQQAPLLVERLRVAGAKVKAVRVDHRAPAAPVGEAPNLRPLKRKLSQAEEAALSKAIDPGCDPDLRSALLRLGRAVKQG